MLFMSKKTRELEKETQRCLEETERVVTRCKKLSDYNTCSPKETLSKLEAEESKKSLFKNIFKSKNK